MARHLGTKFLMVSGLVGLGVGILMIPSNDEKIRKMKEREQKIVAKYEKSLDVEQKRPTSSSPSNINLANKKQSSNVKGESIDVFKDL